MPSDRNIATTGSTHLPRVDAHTHVWDLATARYPWRPSLGVVPDRAAPVDGLIDQLNRNRVHAAILVQPSVYGWDHSHLFDSIARFPDRLLGVGLLDPVDPTWGVRLDDLVRQGARGVRFNLHHRPGAPWITAPEHSGLWDELCERGIPVCFHARHDQLNAVNALAERYPALTVVVDHLGRPAAMDAGSDWSAVTSLARRPAVLVKLSGFQACAPPSGWRRLRHVLGALVAAFGCERLMWGSDAPASLPDAQYADTIAPVADLGLTPIELEQVLGGTACRVFGPLPPP